MEEQVKTAAGQGFGIASLILGIIALLIALIPCIGLFALIPGIIAIVLAIVGLSQANKANGAKGVIIAGLLVPILGTLLAAIWLMFFSAGGALLNELSESEGFEGIVEEIIDDIKEDIDDEVDFEIIIETGADEDIDMEQQLEELEEGESTEESDTEPEDSLGGSS